MKKSKVIKEILLLIVAIFYLSPIYIMLVNSFKNRQELYENVLALPKDFSFQYYIAAIEKMNFLNAFGNSLFITVVSVIFIVILSSMTAWMLARTNNRISKIIFMTFIATMLIPFQTIMMPLMQEMNWIMKTTGIPMLNTRGGLIFMNIGFNTSMAVFLYHGFIKSIPLSLEEAAMIDGASKFGIFWRIIFPMLKPITVTVMILNVISIWNDYLLPSLVLTQKELRTIPLSTFYFFGEFTIQWNQAMAGLVLTIIPVVVFYVFAQKYIIKGIAEGAVK
ncbi:MULTISPECIES: carbohydrate ABC transporter permease [Bacillaceae]|jgi:raffinose/stachyose/melibiose transport system permease protein|uniref:Putative starch degradation products transport system permease protein AmyC n=1 Tax=Caldibacillus thermoamylovorans TaxID=35841 RepID=A0A090J3A8_9BACI|nr:MULTISPECIES: carbohydrate ABC transporter permease [Bacillaceae]MED4852533.1 carbohydrate ABC transporter permease [Caldifermentibacillus hisashii]CEE03168.1 putative starch degradation products transport system permease protein AmyC [Caldibacillus thermoamylovorans]